MTSPAASAAAVVRRLGVADTAEARALFDLMTEVFEEDRPTLSDAYVEGLLRRDDLWILAAFDGPAVIGGLTAHVLPMTRAAVSELFIYDLAVAVAHQRKGVARRLIADLRRRGTDAGIEVSFVPADEEDDHALAFYRAVGGEESRVRFFTFE